MSSKDHKKKYIRHNDSIDDCDREEEEMDNNINVIFSKLEKKINTGNINSGNIDVILQIDKKQDISRKNSTNIITKILNSHIKEQETPQENENSLFSVISIPKGNIAPSKDVSIEMNVDNDLKEKLEEQEKQNIISTNDSKTNTVQNSKSTDVNEINLSTLSSHFDNSRFFLNKQNKKKLIPLRLKISAEKNTKKLNNKNRIVENKDKEKNKNNEKNKEKEKNNDNEKTNDNENQKNKSRNKQSNNIKGANSSIDNINKSMSKTLYQKRCIFGCNFFFDCEITNKKKWKRKLRNCSFITLARNIFITLVVISALGFYIVIFFLT